MKTVGIDNAKLKDCIQDAQRQRVVITRHGKPVALIVGIEGMDLEQVELGLSDKFWKLVKQWRKQKTASRKDLEKLIRSE